MIQIANSEANHSIANLINTRASRRSHPQFIENLRATAAPGDVDSLGPPACLRERANKQKRSRKHDDRRCRSCCCHRRRRRCRWRVAATTRERASGLRAVGHSLAAHRLPRAARTLPLATCKSRRVSKRIDRRCAHSLARWLALARARTQVPTMRALACAPNLRNEAAVAIAKSDEHMQTLVARRR